MRTNVDIKKSRSTKDIGLATMRRAPKLRPEGRREGGKEGRREGGKEGRRGLILRLGREMVKCLALST
jgi:hypothetical protein